MTSQLMHQALQVFALREAARTEAKSSYQNFLIIAAAPAGAAAETAPPEEKVTALAQQLNKDGYAYVARTSQKEMEDDESGVRYLPLRNDLPSFGVMTAVIVIGDPAWAALAAATYPEADIFLM